MGDKGTLGWFRALCDSEGATPCCYNHVCVNKTMDQCTCPDCIDMRRPLHAEYSTWQPTDAACRPRDMRTDEMCQFLGQANLTFIGDSLVRHLYTAFVLLMTGDDQAGAFKPNIPAGKMVEAILVKRIVVEDIEVDVARVVIAAVVVVVGTIAVVLVVYAVF